MKRLFHLLWGHTYIVGSIAFCPGTSKIDTDNTSYDADRRKAAAYITYGRTEFILVCQCGHIRTISALGRHTADSIARA